MVALRRLAAVEVDEVGGPGESVASDFDTVLGASEDGGRVRVRVAGLAMEDETGAGFRAGMLSEEENAGMRAFGGGAVAEPCGEGDAEGEFGRDPTEVEDDGAESSALEKQVGGAESLVEAGVRLAGGWEDRV